MLAIDPLCSHQIGIFVKARTQYGRARAAGYFIIFSLGATINAISRFFRRMR